MAIFNKTDQQADYSSNVTTVSAGSKFTGKIEIECSLHIDGEFDGEISSTSTVEIGKSGVLKGNLKAQKLVVTGKFFGDAECDSIELVSGGEAEGKLVSASLTIDSGSSFQGESIRKRPDSGSTVVDFSAESNPFKESVPDGKKV